MSKKEKNQNALKHGAYSREPMLPGESLRDYETLRAEMCKEWAPEGVTEHGLVDRLVALCWRKQRIDRYEHESLRQRVRQIQAQNELNRHRQDLKDEAPEFGRAASAEAVEQILSELSPYYANTITHWVPREKFQHDLAKWGPAISAFLSRLKPEDQVEGLEKYIALVSPDSIETGLLRADRIDEAIDRTIKRLMQVKTAKQIFPTMGKARTGPQLINQTTSLSPEPAVTIAHERIVALPAKVEVLAEPERNSGSEHLDNETSGPADFASLAKEKPAQSNDQASFG